MAAQPWRILRALVSSGFTTQRWKVIPDDAASLMAKLAGSLPSYLLRRLLWRTAAFHADWSAEQGWEKTRWSSTRGLMSAIRPWRFTGTAN